MYMCIVQSEISCKVTSNSCMAVITGVSLIMSPNIGGQLCNLSSSLLDWLPACLVCHLLAIWLKVKPTSHQTCECVTHNASYECSITFKCQPKVSNHNIPSYIGMLGKLYSSYVYCNGVAPQWLHTIHW